MKDDSLVVSESDEAGNREIQSGLEIPLEVSDAPKPGASNPIPAVEQTNGVNVDRNAAESAAGKSDSEAETVVLSGKEDGKDYKSKKVIKLEELSGADPDPDHQPNGAKTFQDAREGSTEIEALKPSLKRKRVMMEHRNIDDPDGAISSNLSSTISSPVREVRSSKATDTASNRSRSSPPPDEFAQGPERRAYKARTESITTQPHHAGLKNDRGTGPVNGRKRRDTRSATHYDGPTHRSESPPSRHNNRATSTQSNPAHSGVTKRRRAPAPLHVERRRKASEDTHPESEDDSSVHSHHHLQKLASTESNAMSPAKIISHKKNRDRNGRTLLARACQQGDPVEVEKWLKERPQDINVSDNAGNTPFQIAALDGSAEVVQILLDAGCDIDCKNIDKDTPLIDAVENGHLDVVEMLLKAGLDPRQPNAFGKEPLDLVKADYEHADKMREVLQASKREKALLRRPSEDNNRQNSVGSKDVEATIGAGSGVSPVSSNKSPPPTVPGARRRTARSQPTDDALLWVNATPARLRDAAGKGDLTVVDHILKMRPQADTESILAAARGGHDDVLNLMLAIATPDPDPEPLKSSDYKLAYSTPMLAAIGRGNTNIINLLLAQPGFDPTRRLYKGMTYYELAKERQGSEWQEEYELLKEAFDNHQQHRSRKSNHNSPRKGRPKRAGSAKSGSEPSSSPHEARRLRKPNSLKDESSEGMKRDHSYKLTVLPYGEEDKKRISPSLTTDIDLEPLGPPRPQPKEGKVDGDKEHVTSKRADSLKPKRRLMSGNDFKTDQDMRRRASLAAEAELPKHKSGDSTLHHDVRQRRFSDASESKTKASSGETLGTDNAMGKKRHRLSVSPQAQRPEMNGGVDMKSKKRQRVDSQGNAIDQDPDRSFRPGAPAMVANMIASAAAVTSPTVSKGTAPVAFMGSNVTSPVTASPTEMAPPSTTTSPIESIDQALSQRPGPEALQAQHQASQDRSPEKSVQQELEHQALEDKAYAAQVEEDRQRQAQAEQEKQAQAIREEAERKARIAREEEEQARIEELRQSAEAERQIRLEREQEEIRLAKQKQEEDLQQRRLEQERIRKEEQERRRRELEERELLRRLRMQKEEESQRLQSLPNGLRQAAELGPEEARSSKEITKWLPLRTVTTRELDPGCDPQVAEERWIANIQAAPILAVSDLDLSQYTAWTHFPADMSHRGSLWRQLRRCMSQADPTALLTPQEVFHLDEETKPKFFALPHAFWIKLTDFMDIVPRHQHLAGLHFKTRAIVLHEYPFGKGGSWDRPAWTAGAEGPVKQEAHSPMMNGNMTNGFRQSVYIPGEGG